MTSPERLRLAVFDCDGTLVDSQHLILQAMGAAFTALGCEPPAAASVRRVIGLSLAECIDRLAPDESPERRRHLVEAYKEAFFTLRRQPSYHEPLFPGAIEALEALTAAGFLLGVATGKARRGLAAVLEHHGLGRFFHTLQTADDGPGKPHPSMLLRAMAETGAAPADTVMIGDTTFDMTMARGASVAAIGVVWGYHEPAELAAAGAHVLIDSFAELEQVLAALGPAGPPPCA